MALVFSKYSLSLKDSIPASIEILSIVYELNENFNLFNPSIILSQPSAYPRRIPAIERDFENVWTTRTLSYLFINFTALSAPKSTYASSTIINWFELFFTISSISSSFKAIEVGAFGFVIIICPSNPKYFWISISKLSFNGILISFTLNKSA